MPSILVNSKEEMLEFAKSWSTGLRPGTIVYLSGDLGVGKTTFVQGVLEGLGYLATVKSPTFTLVESYLLDNDRNFYHFDLYRIDKREDLEAIGFRDYFSLDNILFIEWPEKAEGYLPVPTYHIKIESFGKQRKLSIES
jgi:tRNA threonylcarbamoyladenosine biosynthesis protein TsaE